MLKIHKVIGEEKLREEILEKNESELQNIIAKLEFKLNNKKEKHDKKL